MKIDTVHWWQFKERKKRIRLVHSDIGRKRYKTLHHILSFTIEIWGESKLNAAPFI